MGRRVKDDGDMKANAIVQAREYVGLTQTQLGERLGVPQSTVCRWERRPAMLRLKDLYRIAAALGVAPERLVSAARPCTPCEAAP